MRPSDAAWITLGTGVLVYEALAKDQELLSHGVDRYLETHPWLSRGVVALVALHLLNLLPPIVDPLAQIEVLRTVARRVYHKCR